MRARTIRSRIIGIAATSLALLGLARPCAAVTSAEVDEAIRRGKEFLYSKQVVAGRWEPDEKRIGSEHNGEQAQGFDYGGFTAIATYALLASGESPQSERITPAIEFLKRCDMVGVYAIALRCQVWTFMPRPMSAEMTKLIRADAQRLLVLQEQEGPARGLWHYGPAARIDHSVGQYGVLGLWACAQEDVPIDDRVWAIIDESWRGHQFADGSWNYNGNGKGGYVGSQPNAAMTAAGIATLFITQDYLHSNEGVECHGNVTNPNIQSGLDWMTKNFAQIGENNYAWYGVERIGVSSGYKFFGQTDWYAAGAQSLVKSQKPDGSWSTMFPGRTVIPDTAFALLFLSRGRAPVMMNKLDYSAIANAPKPNATAPSTAPEAAEKAAPAPAPAPAPARTANARANKAGPIRGKAAAGKKSATAPAETQPEDLTLHWNQRPRDVANLVRWSGRRTERYLNWQIVNLKVGADDLRDAPILYITGDQAIPFDDDEAATLRAFAESGGLILANADCGSEAFAESFRELGKKIFPDYAFRELPADHPIFVRQQFVKWRRPVPVQGLSNGVRELMILIPQDDASKTWQSGDRREELYQVGANIYQYAVDKTDIRKKDESYVLRPSGAIPSGAIRIARLNVGGNWAPEPGGWRRMAIFMLNNQKVALEPQVVVPGEGKLDGFRLAHMTGTTAIKLSDAARKEIQAFVVNGGTLIIDAAGGSAEFAKSAESELTAIFGVQAVTASEALPASSNVFNWPGAKIETFNHRQFARNMESGLKGPRLKAISVNNRLAVFFSREDLSNGLVGQEVDGVYGYDPATATAIMRNLILFGENSGRPPTSAPSAVGAGR